MCRTYLYNQFKDIFFDIIALNDEKRQVCFDQFFLCTCLFCKIDWLWKYTRTVLNSYLFTFLLDGTARAAGHVTAVGIYVGVCSKRLTQLLRLSNTDSALVQTDFLF